MHYRVIIFFVILVSNLAISLDAQTSNEALLQNTRQLIFEGKRSGEGYFSKDGRYLIFQGEREAENPFFQIYTLDFQTGDIALVSPGHGKTTCAYFNWANENEIMFSSTHLDPEARNKQKLELQFRASGKSRRYSWNFSESMDIFSSKRDGSDIKQITNTVGYDAEGSYSPDGTKIAFCSNRSGFQTTLTEDQEFRLKNDPSYFGEIYIMDADGSNLKRLTTSNGYDGGPFFSPSGERIVWRKFDDSGHIADIFTMKIDGSDVQQVTDFKSMSWAPYYHPSEDYIIFASNILGYSNFEIFIVDAAGTKEPVQVTHTEGFDGLPVFSPDGKKIAFTSNRTEEKVSQLFYADWDHEAALRALENSPARAVQNNGQLLEKYTAEITADELKSKVTYLASDELEGRMTGSEGCQKAAAFISNTFENWNLEPFQNDDFYHNFEYTSGIVLEKSNNSFVLDANGKTTKFKLSKDFQPLPFSDNGRLEKSDLVFAGYGIKVPEGKLLDYNSYMNMDVQDKTVLVLAGIPEGFEKDEEAKLARYSSTRYKTLIARELGAKGIIFIESEIKDFNQQPTSGSSGMMALEISEKTANKFLTTKEVTVAELKTRLKENNPHLEVTFDIPGIKMTSEVNLKKNKKADNNVVGMIKADKPTDDFIIIGGHYDHLGYGHIGSRAIAGEEHQIHNGADDNASGTALVMELAEYYSQLKKDNPSVITKNLVFALWSGEEMGLLGSSYFVENLDQNKNNFVAYLNFDMVGMLKENKLNVQGLGSGKEWRKILEKKNIVSGFNLSMSDDPYLPTDATSFYQIGVPIMSFFTGVHDDYHRPTDDPELLNYEGLSKITGFANLITQELLKPTTTVTYEKVEISANKKASMRGFTVFLGTIPDYGSDVQGVKLSGVRANGPADKAGVQSDDIIVFLAGKEIKNIYDYTYILGELTANEPTKITVLRNGKRLELDITPEAK